MDIKKSIRYAASLLMAVAMVAVAEWSAEPEILFPEMVALTIGLWIVDKRVWRAGRFQIIGLMTLGATAGLCLALYSPFPPPVNFCLAFAFAGICLLITRTTLIPLLSACMLPVLLHTQSWIYPAAVCAMSAIVVTGQKIMEHYGLRRRTEFTPGNAPGKKEIRQWLGLLGSIIPAVILSNITGCPYLVIPPLIVTFAEMVFSKAGFRYRPVQVFLILAAAATIGSMAQLFGYYMLHLPQWVVALVIAITLFSLFELAGKFFAPAGALAFIPMLMPQEALVWLPIQASAGAALFITVALVLFMRCYRWTPAQLVFCLTPAPVREYIGRTWRTEERRNRTK